MSTPYPAQATLFSCLLVLTFPTIGAAQQTEYLSAAADSVMFIYEGGAIDPCADPPPGLTLLPLGTGFVTGIPKKGLPPDSPTWTGVKFLITAKHVVGGKSKIIVRLNRKDKAEFTCFPLELKWDGKEQNTFVAEKPQVDLAAI